MPLSQVPISLPKQHQIEIHTHNGKSSTLSLWPSLCCTDGWISLPSTTHRLLHRFHELYVCFAVDNSIKEIYTVYITMATLLLEEKKNANKKMKELTCTFNVLAFSWTNGCVWGERQKVGFSVSVPQNGKCLWHTVQWYRFFSFWATYRKRTWFSDAPQSFPNCVQVQMTFFQLSVLSFKNI